VLGEGRTCGGGFIAWQAVVFAGVSAAITPQLTESVGLVPLTSGLI